LYAGQRILDGAVPYRDVWDHKGPLIFYIDALGLAIGGGSRWGVWFLEILFAWVASVFAFKFFDLKLGHWPAIFGSVLFLLFLSPLLDGGNLVEEYALVFQFIFLFALAKATERSESKLLILMGMSAAAAFLLRPNIIGLPLALGLLWVWKAFAQQNRREFGKWVYVLIGAAGILLLAAGYFAAKQALTQLWDAAFTFNFLYTKATFPERLVSVQTGLSQTGALGALALAGWIFAIFTLRSQPKTFGKDLGTLLTLAFPIEILLAALPGRSYTHYYMSWLPVFVSLAAFLLACLGELIKKAPNGVFRSLSLSLLLGFSLMPVWRLLPPLSDTVGRVVEQKGIPSISLSGNRLEPTLRYLNENTDPAQKVLVWGNFVAVNWLSGRAAPTRFVYQTALFEEQYLKPEMVAEIIADLRAHPETLIIDTTEDDRSLAVDLDNVPPMLRPLYEFIRENYEPADKMGRTGWQLYLPVTDAAN
jgi:hypothetical protein